MPLTSPATHEQALHTCMTEQDPTDHCFHSAVVDLGLAELDEPLSGVPGGWKASVDHPNQGGSKATLHHIGQLLWPCLHITAGKHRSD